MVKKVVLKAFLRPCFPFTRLLVWSWKPFQDHLKNSPALRTPECPKRHVQGFQRWITRASGIPDGWYGSFSFFCCSHLPLLHFPDFSFKRENCKSAFRQVSLFGNQGETARWRAGLACQSPLAEANTWRPGYLASAVRIPLGPPVGTCWEIRGCSILSIACIP